MNPNNRNILSHIETFDGDSVKDDTIIGEGNYSPVPVQDLELLYGTDGEAI